VHLQHREKKTIFQGEGYIFAVTGYVTGYRKCNLLGGYKVTGYRTFKSKSFVNSPSSLYCHPPNCNAHTIATVLHEYCEVYAPPRTPVFHAIHYTTLVHPTPVLHAIHYTPLVNPTPVLRAIHYTTLVHPTPVLHAIHYTTLVHPNPRPNLPPASYGIQYNIGNVRVNPSSSATTN